MILIMLLVRSNDVGQVGLKQTLEELKNELRMNVAFFSTLDKDPDTAEMAVFFLDRDSRLKVPLLQVALEERNFKVKALIEDYYGMV